MFDVGFSELVLLAIVALVVLGPEKLPHAARIAGAWVGRIRRTVSSMQAEIEREVMAQEMKARMEKEFGALGGGNIMQELQSELHDADASMRAALASAEQPDPEPAVTPPVATTTAPVISASSEASDTGPARTAGLLTDASKPLADINVDGEQAYREWLEAQKRNRIAPPGLTSTDKTSS